MENLVKIVRKGFPGKNREILLTYSLTNIKSIIFCIEGHGCCNSCFHELKRKNVLQCPVCRGPKLVNPRNIL